MRALISLAFRVSVLQIVVGEPQSKLLDTLSNNIVISSTPIVKLITRFIMIRNEFSKLSL